MGLVTVALQVSHEYNVCWKTATWRELSYSAQKQIRPFIKGMIPGHLSLLSCLYSVPKRKTNTTLCPRSKKLLNSWLQFPHCWAPATELLTEVTVQERTLVPGISPSIPSPLCILAVLLRMRWSYRILISFVTLLPGLLILHVLPFSSARTSLLTDKEMPSKMGTLCSCGLAQAWSLQACVLS